MTETTTPDQPERRTGRRLLLGGGLAAMATGAALVPGRASAASGTSPWLLGGNTGVATDGSNYLGTQNVAPLVFKTASTAGAPAERMRIAPNGRVGIGTNAPGTRLDVRAASDIALRATTTGNTATDVGVYGGTTNGTGVQGRHSGTTGSNPGVLGETNSTAANAAGVTGRANPTNAGATSGVYGLNQGTNNSGVGVYGQHKGGGYGVLGVAATGGFGVVGQGGIGVDGSSVDGTGVHGSHTDFTGTSPGVLGETDSEDDDAAGVVGRVNRINPGASSGVHGINNGTGPSGVGVFGEHAGAGYGVYGLADAGSGVVGQGTVGVSGNSVDGTGVAGAHSAANGTAPGVSGVTASRSGGAAGVLGRVTTSSPGASSGVHGVNNGTGASGVGVYGEHAGNGYGVLGTSVNGRSVVGRITAASASADAIAVWGDANSSGTGVWGSSGYGGTGVRGDGSAGVHGKGRLGVWAEAGSDAAVDVFALFADARSGSTSGRVLAGHFEGNVEIIGTLSKSAGSFVIDHPLEPATKTLTHSFVESDEMKNVYDGVVMTDRSGHASVELPRWFEPLNKDLRYQLTTIGRAHAWVESKIENGRFVVGTDQPGVEVCWQVTGVRQDAYANEHRLPVESDKPGPKRGKYLHPELFGKGPEHGISPMPATAP